jgi:hypothetical protein
MARPPLLHVGGQAGSDAAAAGQPGLRGILSFFWIPIAQVHCKRFTIIDICRKYNVDVVELFLSKKNICSVLANPAEL